MNLETFSRSILEGKEVNIKDLNPIYLDRLLDYASQKRYIEVLKWSINYDLKYTTDAIDYASQEGHIDVLNWWLRSGLPLKYTTDAIDLASTNGFVDVLDWWLKSGLELKYTSDAMDYASGRGYITVLNWWKRSGLPLKYTEKSIDLASIESYIHILEWWKKSKLELKYSNEAIDLLIIANNISMLKWWKNSGLPLKYSLDIAKEASHIFKHLGEKIDSNNLYKRNNPNNKMEKHYTDEELLLNTHILTKDDGTIRVRDDIRKKGIDITFDKWLDEPIQNYYNTIYLLRVSQLLQEGEKFSKIIKLDERQILDVNRLYHIILKTGRAVDISPAGSGKSLIAMVLAIMLDVKGIIVIAGKSIESTWEAMERKDFAGVNIKFYRTNTIIGTKANIPDGSGFLKGKYMYDRKGNQMPGLGYRAGKEFIKKVKKGYLFMFDEFQSGKNDNNVSRGFHALVEYFCSTIDTKNNKSAILFSSASPSDKSVISPIFYMLNLTSHEKLVTGGRGLQEKDRTGLEESIEYNNKIDKYVNKECMRSVFKKVDLDNVNDSKLNENSVNNYLRCIMEGIYIKRFFSYTSNKSSDIIKNNLDRRYKPDVYYYLTKLNYKDGFDPFLKMFSHYVSRTIKGRGHILVIYNSIMRAFAFLIIPIIVDMAIEKLVSNINAKVVVYTNIVTQKIKSKKKKDEMSVDIIDYITRMIKKGLKKRRDEMLERKEERAKILRRRRKEEGGKRSYDEEVHDEKVISIASDTEITERTEEVELFQENNSKCRCIVTSIGVLSTGVSLDDEFKVIECPEDSDLFPRTFIPMPNYRGDFTVQLMGRGFRRNTKSKGEIIFPIAIGNKVGQNIGDKVKFFSSLEDYEEAAGIQQIQIQDVGRIPYGHLNYAIAKILNKKSENIDTFNTDSLTDELKNIGYMFDPIPRYPLSGKIESEFKDYMSKIEREIVRKMEDDEVLHL